MNYWSHVHFKKNKIDFILDSYIRYIVEQMGTWV